VKKELNPVVVWVILGVAALVVIVIGYRVLAPKPFVPDRTGSEQAMQKVKTTGKFYSPPAGAPFAGGGGATTPGGATPTTGSK